MRVIITVRTLSAPKGNSASLEEELDLRIALRFHLGQVTDRLSQVLAPRTVLDGL